MTIKNWQLLLTTMGIAFITAILIIIIGIQIYDLDDNENDEINDSIENQIENNENDSEDIVQDHPLLSKAAFNFDSSLTRTELDGSILVRTAVITNPSTNDKQSVRVYTPQEDGTYPTVFFIPGGTGNGSEFERTRFLDNGDRTLADTLTLAQEGFSVVVYDPLGRGDSEGEINFQGHYDQDGLAYIIAAAKKLPEVDTSNMGIASFSYGVTAAAGVLARYPELGIRFWSDWEGPSSRKYTTIGCKSPGSSDPRSPAQFACDDEEHWEEREASEFMKTLSIDYYWRIQEEKDHVQDGYGHTIEMLNAASKNENINWFTVNNTVPNITFTKTTLKTVPNDDQFPAYVFPHLLEMAAK